MTSHEHWAKALFSDSQDDLEVLDCFLEFQEIARGSSKEENVCSDWKFIIYILLVVNVSIAMQKVFLPLCKEQAQVWIPSQVAQIVFCSLQVRHLTILHKYANHIDNMGKIRSNFGEEEKFAD